MTVKEVIEELQKLDQTMQVWVKDHMGDPVEATFVIVQKEWDYVAGKRQEIEVACVY